MYSVDMLTQEDNVRLGRFAVKKKVSVLFDAVFEISILLIYQVNEMWGLTTSLFLPFKYSFQKVFNYLQGLHPNSSKDETVAII